ncbi:MAG TPA: hypothetical protein VIN39_04635 [Candidatus Dormibacteraeota bacterium]
MAFPATRVRAISPGRPRLEVRWARLLITAATSLGLLVGALHLGPFMPAGADPGDLGQRAYAANLWQEVQTSLMVLAVFLPWLLYGLLFLGSPWGSRILIVAAAAGTVLATWITVISVDSYAALPRSVTGVVNRVQGRALQLSGPGRYYLVLSDSEMAAARTRLKPGTSVTMWVSPRGQVGWVKPGDV